MAKRLELLKELVPTMRQAAVLLNPDNAANGPVRQAMEIQGAPAHVAARVRLQACERWSRHAVAAGLPRAQEYPASRAEQQSHRTALASHIFWPTPWSVPFYDAELGKRHLAELDPFVFDIAFGRMVITYQTFIVRTRACSIATVRGLDPHSRV